MTEPRNEFGFEEWAEKFGLGYYPNEDEMCRQAWHAAIDAIRAKLAGNGYDLDILLSDRNG